jgi:thiol:disulfide interchange protein
MQFKSLLTSLSKGSLVLVASATLSFAMLASTAVPADSQEEGSQKAEGSQKVEAPQKTEGTKDAPEGLNWHKDFDSAMVEAKQQQKFVLVDVYTDWCVYCKKLDKEVYTNPDVEKYLAEKFILVKADAEDKAQGEAFCTKFDAFGAYPTILFFDTKSKKEKPVSRIAGYLPPTEFNAALHSIVESKKYKPKHNK